MIEVRPTEELNAWQVYRQAKSLAKHTSRAHNPDWYRGALDLDRQWHIWFDGQRAVSAVFDRVSSGWTTGPQPILPHPREMHGGGEKGAAFDDGSLRALHETLHQLIQGRELGGKAKSLGVVIHLADEFSISEISPEYAIDEDFNAVAALLEADPMEAIGDANLDLRAHSWRLLPYWGVREGERRAVAVQTGRALQPLVEELRKYGETRNVPVIATCVSAPIEALRMGPFFIDANEDQRKGNIFVFLYQRFSLLAVCDSQGELVQARALQHRAGQTYPTGLGDTLVNTAAAVNLEEPHVHLVAMAEVNAEGLSAELSAFFASRPPMNIGLVNAREIEEFRALPGNCAEMALGDPQITSRLEQHAPLLESVSFRNLAAGWAIQDFATRLGEVAVNYPSLKDLKLLRAFGMLKFLLVAVVVGVGAWTGLDLFRTMTTDAWKLPEDKASTASAELEKLKQEKGRVE
ncbi:MAG: hypothetical protein KDM91_05615, partial [Verrucomicrobiae bacterium]|nr:hypothetical protein [Verrucomicrobiae bacterium]